MYKKILSTMLAMVMMFGIVVPVYADDYLNEPIDMNDTEQKTVEYSRSVIPNGLLEATEKEMSKWKDVKKPISKVKQFSRASETRSSWESLSDFGYYGQLKNYSCGSACVRMALKHITGTKYAESTIREGVNGDSHSGAKVSELAEYINEEQDDNAYVVRYNQNKDTMKKNLLAGIATYDAPPIVGIQESTDDGWPYDFAGHAIIVYGAKKNKSRFAICVPWAGYIDDDDNRWYQKSANDLYDAYDVINAGYMY